MRLQWLGNDVGNAPARIQACVRILKNHLQLLPQRPPTLRIHFAQIAAEKFNMAIGGNVESHQQPRDR